MKPRPRRYHSSDAGRRLEFRVVNSLHIPSIPFIEILRVEARTMVGSASSGQPEGRHHLLSTGANRQAGRRSDPACATRRLGLTATVRGPIYKNGFVDETQGDHGPLTHH
jgi:hypothetical protein